MNAIELQTIFVLLDKIFTKLEKRNKETLDDDLYDNLTLSESKTIFAIGKNQSKTMTQISKQLGIAPNTATVAIDRLVSKELACRELNYEDRRQQLVKLTLKGIEIMDQFDKDMMVETAHFLSPLSDAEILLFKNLLEKIDSKL